jgi:hypothetical protein
MASGETHQGESISRAWSTALVGLEGENSPAPIRPESIKAVESLCLFFNRICLYATQAPELLVVGSPDPLAGHHDVLMFYKKGSLICKECGADLGIIYEIKKGAVQVQLLRVGSMFILDERALCSVCQRPVYWNTGLNNLQKLADL